MRTRHATLPPAVPMVERATEGGGGGDLTGGPLDGQTNRGSNPRPRRAPSMAHTTRPSMSLTLSGTKKFSKLTSFFQSIWLIFHELIFHGEKEETLMS